MQQDIYTRITNKIMAELEAGTAPWVRPWSAGQAALPRNALSQRPYRGINTVLLSMESSLHQYSSDQWLTFRQAQQLGATVRKGEAGTPIIYYEMRLVEKGQEEVVAEDDEENQRFVPLLKVFTVFNLDQIDGLPDSYRNVVVPPLHWTASETAEQIMQFSGADIRHQGFRAFYSPPNDRIYLPPKHSFVDEPAYYGTALHELCHWTGHCSRLGRKLGRRFGDAAYAMEELVAEMGAAFLSAHCRLDGRLQHASYIASWLEVLDRDKRAVFLAAAQAQKAADFLLSSAGLIRPSEAMPLAA